MPNVQGTGDIGWSNIQYQQLLAFTGTGATSDLRVGNGVQAYNLADLTGAGFTAAGTGIGRVANLSGLDAGDDPIRITGLGKLNANGLGASGTSSNAITFSNDTGFGFTNLAGAETASNASRLNDGDSITFAIQQGKALASAVFTVRSATGAAVVLDSDGATVKDTNGAAQGGFAQDASAGELNLGVLANGTRISIDFLQKSILIDGAAFTGNTAAFFNSFATNGFDKLTLGSAVASAQGQVNVVSTGWSADDLVLTTKLANEQAVISAASTAEGCVTENLAPETWGKVVVVDAEAAWNPQSFQTPASLTGTYGNFTFDTLSGVWTYKLNGAAEPLKAGQQASDKLTVTSYDGTATQDIVVHITGTNDAPALTAAPAMLADGTEDVSYTITKAQILQGWTDVDGDTLSIAGLTASNGTVTANQDGSYTITPGANYNGPVTLGYTVTDGHAQVAASLGYSLVAVNDAPALTTAAAVLANGTEDVSYTITKAQLLQGWTDVDGDTLSVTGLTASNGTVIANQDGSYTITPGANYSGPVTLGYTVTDGHAQVAASLGYSLAAVNDPASIVFSGDFAVAENEAPATLTATGSYIVTDVDSPTTATVANKAGFSNLGSLALNAGNYTYSVANSAVQYLGAEETRTETFTITSADGTTKDVSFTITGKANGPILPTASDAGNDSRDENQTGGMPPVKTTSLVSNSVDDNTYTGTNREDSVSLGAGNDSADGRSGSDYIDGGSGRDTLLGSSGDDTLIGGPDDDSLNGGQNNDAIYGQGGNDILIGDSNDDWVFGGTGNDFIQGNDNKDTLYGGSGQDTIDGGKNDDTIQGGFGADLLTGGDGKDLFKYVDVRDTNDTITDFQNDDDRLDFGDLFSGTLGFRTGQNTAFTAQNQVIWYQDGTNTIVAVNLDGDPATAELAITLTGLKALTASDFIL
ncbi:hypothetical protein CKO45_26110 [Paracraurococcus ruber]|uniref:Cadherin-like domain-containing protein n=2 Tax=Paracraurococcus ruber TaxID=77675 RepID=A0ABS1D736_9PROT|nr:hypothetical protein [Paracraurococcus ruber]